MYTPFRMAPKSPVMKKMMEPKDINKNGKIDGWEQKLSSITTWSVSYKEMLEAKIAHAESLKQANNC